MSICIIAAIADNGVIGSQNDLPWYIPEDLRHFKKITHDHTVVMGRKTFDSIIARLGKPLPGRKNIVISRSGSLDKFSEVEYIHDITEIIKKQTDIYVIGGGTIYELFLPFCDRMEITHVHQNPTGDVYFPKIDWSSWQETAREDHDGFSFITYSKK